MFGYGNAPGDEGYHVPHADNTQLSEAPHAEAQRFLHLGHDTS